jgi:hypothetical protein
MARTLFVFVRVISWIVLTKQFFKADNAESKALVQFERVVKYQSITEPRSGSDRVFALPFKLVLSLVAGRVTEPGRYRSSVLKLSGSASRLPNCIRPKS